MRLKESVRLYDLSKTLVNLLHNELIELFEINSDILNRFAFVSVQFEAIYIFDKIRIELFNRT
jgi:hypothetical protein